ncbi:MAG: TolC family outer membrane protein [Pseudomonadota bacterium]
MVPTVMQWRRLRRTASAVGVALTLAGGARAVTLEQAYDAAFKNEPAYRMSIAEHAAGVENAVLGRSNLLPNVQASFSGSENHADQSTDYGPQGIINGHPHYISRSSVIQLRQPLFSLDALARYRQGVAQARQSESAFTLNTGEMVLRVVGAYVDVLFAGDQVLTLEAQRDALLEQRNVNDRMFLRGEGTKTDQLETQARLDVAEVQLIEARDNLVAVRHTLEGMMGQPAGELTPLASRFLVEPLAPASFDEWKVIALAHNPELLAARQSVEVAQQEVNKGKAGHTPRVDLVASYSKSNADSVNTYNQSTVNRSIGVQVTLPLYAGGSVNAVSRQAVAGLDRARADLDNRANRMLVELRKAHDITVSSARRMEALQKAVESGELLLKATEQSIKGGVRINLDLLNARQQLASTRRDLAQTRYNYVLNLLRLRAGAGTLSAGDVHEVARFFQ